MKYNALVLFLAIYIILKGCIYLPMSRIFWKCPWSKQQKDKSVKFKAKEIEANVLLLHGDEDKRVPIKHSEIMLQALFDNNKDTSLHRGTLN